ncbi:MAG: hypothetical protein NVS4B10_03310 [Myxococcales bacterium]
MGSPVPLGALDGIAMDLDAHFKRLLELVAQRFHAPLIDVGLARLRLHVPQLYQLNRLRTHGLAP